MDILTIGFGTTVAMWGVGYLCRMPPAWAPSWLVLFLLVACLVGGGFVAGRSTDRGRIAGIFVGLLSAVLNMLILGSLLAGEAPNRVVPGALWWIPGSIIASALFGFLGSVIGASSRADGRPRTDWTALFARVTAAATFLLLVVGGLVTSHRAGLAVVDWPSSFGYNMFLYPLSRMTGGIYYEHAHRLFGALVGLTTLALALHLQRADSRRWLRRLAGAALLTVIAQGLLGGLRVTASSIALAVVHGVLAQLFFGMIVGIVVFTSTTWKGGRPASVVSSSSTDRSLSALLTALLIVQLVLGAIQRHLAGGLLIHITMAVVVFLLALTCGLRSWGMYKEQPIVQTIGRLLAAAASLQILLGIGALIGQAIDADAPSPQALSVILRTAHQGVGAILLALSTMLTLWTRRLLRTLAQP